MREAPANVKRLLRDYDRRLSIVWDAEFHGWRLVYDGEPQREILLHEDGTPIGDLYLGELEAYLRRCDRQNHGETWRRESYRRRRERAGLQAQWVERRHEEGRREAESVMRHLRRGGPPTMIQIRPRKEQPCTPIRPSSTCRRRATSAPTPRWPST